MQERHLLRFCKNGGQCGGTWRRNQTYQDQAVDEVTSGEVEERDCWVQVMLGRCEGMGGDWGHKVKNRVWQGDPCKRSLHEGGVTHTLCERTGLEELADGVS